MDKKCEIVRKIFGIKLEILVSIGFSEFLNCDFISDILYQTFWYIYIILVSWHFHIHFLTFFAGANFLTFFAKANFLTFLTPEKNPAGVDRTPLQTLPCLIPGISRKCRPSVPETWWRQIFLLNLHIFRENSNVLKIEFLQV